MFITTPLYHIPGIPLLLEQIFVSRKTRLLNPSRPIILHERFSSRHRTTVSIDLYNTLVATVFCREIQGM